MDANNWLAGGAILGVLMGCWSYVKIAGWRLLTLVVLRVQVRNEIPANSVVRVLLRDWRPSPWYEPSFGSSRAYDERGEQREPIYEHLGDRSRLFWRGRQFAFVSSQNDRLYLLSLRGCLDVDALMRAAETTTDARFDEFERRHRDEQMFWIHRPRPASSPPASVGLAGQAPGAFKGSAESSQAVQREPDSTFVESGQTCSLLQSPLHRRVTTAARFGAPAQRVRRPVELLCLDDAARQAFARAEEWAESSEWFRDRGLPWKRGWLLHGKPGTGKTSIVRALGQTLRWSLSVYELAGWTCEDFDRVWADARAVCRQIILFEDIDNVFHGRRNVSNDANNQQRLELNAGGQHGSPLLTFDKLLNAIDGVEEVNGMFVVFTANDVGKVDAAIGAPQADERRSNRPGRVDEVLEFGPLAAGHRDKLARLLLDDEKLIAEVCAYPDECTPAQFRELCVAAALDARFADRGVSASRPTARLDRRGPVCEICPPRE